MYLLDIKDIKKNSEKNKDSRILRNALIVQ